MRRLILGLVASLGVLALASAAQATLLAPGTSTAGVAIADTRGALLADTGVKPFSFPGTSGTVEEWVYRDTVTGNLDFVYQASVGGSSGLLEKVTGASYAKFTTDVGYIAVASGVAPATVSRSSLGADNGAVVSFNFPDGSATGAILHGQTSDLLVIKTNSPDFQGGSIGLIDGGGTTVPGFAPGPAPNTLVLAGAAFASLMIGGAVWRRRQASSVLA
jgi:hypothetical protein